jgi:hypothetical protein
MGRLATAVLPHYGAKCHSRIVLTDDGGLREVHTSAKHADHQEDALEQGLPRSSAGAKLRAFL